MTVYAAEAKLQDSVEQQALVEQKKLASSFSKRMAASVSRIVSIMTPQDLASSTRQKWEKMCPKLHKRPRTREQLSIRETVQDFNTINADL